jgi:hypothetical protein
MDVARTSPIGVRASTRVTLAPTSAKAPARTKAELKLPVGLAPTPESQVRIRLPAGGKEIRTVGPAVKEKPFRRAIWLLGARTYRTSGLADETGTSRIKNLRCPDVGPRVRTAPSSAASYKPDRP